MTDLAVFQAFMGVYWARLKELRADERGMTTETVIITAVRYRGFEPEPSASVPSGAPGTTGGSASSEGAA